jgi:hypothetical protein
MRRAARWTARGVLCASLLLTAGCVAVGAAAGKIMGQPAQEAKFKPANLPTLVLAENFKSPSSSVLEADEIARYVNDELEQNKVAPMINPILAQNISTTRPSEFKKMSIATIGRELGAQQVIYISVQATQIEEIAGSGVAKGRGFAKVKLIDARSGDTLWPNELADGYPVAFESAPVNPSLAKTSSVGSIYQAVQQGLAIQISRLFYSYKPD